MNIGSYVTRILFGIAVLALLGGCDARTIIAVDEPDSGGDSDGDSDTDSDSDSDADSDADTDTLPSDRVVATIHVPPDFDETAVEINFKLFDSPPPPPPGPPDYETGHANPEIGPDAPYEFVHPQPVFPPLVGEYFLAVVLFVEGGGSDTGIPVGEVDYARHSSTPITLGPGTGVVDAGNIFLELVPPTKK